MRVLEGIRNRDRTEGYVNMVPKAEIQSVVRSYTYWITEQIPTFIPTYR